MYVIKLNYKILSLGLILLLAAGFFIAGDSGSSVPTEAVEAEGIPLPVIMYHQILKDTERSGDYVVTPDTLTEDIKYMKEKGCNFVTSKELIDYVYNGKALPEKPVLLSFDDGYETWYGYVLPILKEQGAKGVFNIIGIHSQKYSDTEEHNLNYAHLTWDEIKLLADSGCAEIGSHTYDMHSSSPRQGIKIMPGENPEEYKSLLKADLSKLQLKLEEILGASPETFAYPFGFTCPEAGEVIKECGFKITLSCTEGVSLITRDPECLYDLKRYNRPASAERTAFFAKMGIK